MPRKPPYAFISSNYVHSCHSCPAISMFYDHLIIIHDTSCYTIRSTAVSCSVASVIRTSWCKGLYITYQDDIVHGYARVWLGSLKQYVILCKKTKYSTGDPPHNRADLHTTKHCAAHNRASCRQNGSTWTRRFGTKTSGFGAFKFVTGTNVFKALFSVMVRHVWAKLITAENIRRLKTLFVKTLDCHNKYARLCATRARLCSGPCLGRIYARLCAQCATN